jgi:hypothetical protein
MGSNISGVACSNISTQAYFVASINAIELESTT